MNCPYSEKEQVAQNYYDNLDTDKMYAIVWGGEHIHFGIYLESDDSIPKASQLIEVKHGSFENIPYPDQSFDLVWSQDSIIHSGNRRQVLEEIRRVLKPGGELIFTDTLQNDNCSAEKLQPAFNRLQINDAGSFSFYRNTLQELGFQEIKVIDLSEHVSTHYIRFQDEILKHHEEIIKQTSKEFIEQTLKSIEPWITFYQKGDMQWGLFYYHLP